MHRIVGVAIIAVLAVGVAYAFSAPPVQEAYPEALTIAKNVSTFEELSGRFSSLAQEKGGVYAFEILRRAALPPNTDLHLLGHVVGDELYKQKGVEGIADCTQEFRNACSHSIVIGALNEFGNEALSLIRDACKRAPGGSGAYTMCFHGLGHGVFAYHGYSLPETVEFCRLTGTSEYREREYVECVGGAVMELMGGGGHDREKWLIAREKYLTADPLSPCTDAVIPSATKEICLTYLTPRLFELAGANLANPNPSTFATAFGFCERIPAHEFSLRRACLGGFGKEFVPLAGARDIRDISSYTDTSFSAAIGWCMSAPTQEGKDACVAEGLSSVFWGGENDPSTAFRFCALVEDAHASDACSERLAANITSYIQDESVRTNLCEQLSEEFQGQC